MEIGRVDESPHQPGSEPGWSEWWSAAWWSRDATIGGSVRLEVFPRLGRSWLWATCIGPWRRTVSVHEPDAPLPRTDSLELRSSGLWVDLIAQTPGVHFTVGLEAFGIGMDDPAEGFGRGWGERVPLGLDLEWETTAPATPLDGDAGYAIGCVAHGEVLVGSEAFDLDGWGVRSHGWGETAAWTSAEAWAVDGGGMPVAVSPADDEILAWAGAPVASPDQLPRLGRREALLAGREGSWVGWLSDVVVLDGRGPSGP
ncbi:MAG: hypothetical protein ACE367_23575 [Acidimicrobiales bacterium]